MLVISCPTCRKSERIESIKTWPYFPFCGERCKIIDLGNWLDEAYHLADTDEPVESIPDELAD